jgi:flagellar biosynthetic protein FliP
VILLRALPLLLVLLTAPLEAAKQAARTAPAGPLLGANITPGAAGSISAPMQIVILLTILTLLPAIVMSITPFLRIVVVLHFLRQALGTQSTPSNQVLIGLALFLTVLIMSPVATDMYHKGWEPLESGQLTFSAAFDEGAKPLRAFLLRFAREKDIALFVEVTHSPAPKTPAELDLKVLVPAYILSELKAGFQIGAVLYLPFLVIDIVIASVTLSIGMMQLPPVMLSGPFKVLLFVLVDGWNLVVGSLIRGFYS